MASNKNRIKNRDRLFFILEEYQNKTDSIITLYFNQREDLKVDIKVNNKKPQAYLNEEHKELFQQINFDEIYNNISGTYQEGEFAKNDFKRCYEKVKSAIKSNTLISLNSLCAGMFGPIDNPNRGTQIYSAHDYFYFKVNDIISIHTEFQDVLKNYEEDYINPNSLAELLSKENILVDLDDEYIEDELEDGEIVETGARNIIFFGPPGTGKSFRFKENAKTILVDSKDTIRVTFHPEYSYYDFVGQYKPVVGYEFIKNKVIDYTGKEMIPQSNYPTNEFKKPLVYYDFVPGPFTKAIIKALKLEKENKNVLLLIEEINRGNCSAIFGDIFQLLDRVNDIDRDDYGKSEYPIDIPEEMKNYIMDQLDWFDEDWKTHFQKGFVLPANLFIFATMNTSDQSLFPIDSAFKRRWSMEYISIDYETNELKDLYLPAPYGSIKWLDFIKVINKKIVEYTETDDKQMGQWFVGRELDKSGFLGKVLSYLWFDVFRQQPKVLFKDHIRTFDDVKNFYEDGVIKTEIIDEMIDKNV